MTEDFFFVCPATGQRLPVGVRRLRDPRPNIFPNPPQAGLVISTYGAPRSVELALMVRQLLYPDLTVLVHDDASPVGAELEALYGRYNAEFQSNSSRLGHQIGDLSSFVGGLRWAQERGIDLLVKMSRRFIPLTNWVPGLAALASASQFPTFCNVCWHFRFPVRSECVAMYVADWAADDVAGEISRFTLTNLGSVTIERYVYDYALKVSIRLCDAALVWEQQTSGAGQRPGFAIWDFVGGNRMEAARGHLWHDANRPEDYAGLARTLGLNFGPDAFAVGERV